MEHAPNDLSQKSPTTSRAAGSAQIPDAQMIVEWPASDQTITKTRAHWISECAI